MMKTRFSLFSLFSLLSIQMCVVCVLAMGLGACADSNLQRKDINEPNNTAKSSDSDAVPEHFQSYEDFLAWFDEQDEVFMPNVLFIEVDKAPDVLVEETWIGLPVADELDPDEPMPGLFGGVDTKKNDNNHYVVGTVVVSLSIDYPFLRRITGAPNHQDGYDIYPAVPAGLHEVYLKINPESK